ncbi:Glycosyltransferase subfamily 4-like, N-terminal domain protein [Acididesulfobacillus acetoxydans]|uniref:Glycosyl transferase group 1 n=1 Tax=Acididesulfobacillus acetoxydans TaxID=1561005 RepID=A0A8S0Y1L7_9FIRM|nr:glycosyltransferase [Acididesulfobacillus acetoxydans]CAA7599625.1 Glycosyltransferase subfamily 4-like, N-terminal domain protein [Acididesulfobacillus acetoxydans]CEJ06464.1 Glycosyl transferase group 1 [Acididesulfobacillus acetoxydans]
MGEPREPLKKPRKVLFIAYFFPPLGGSGVQRTLKFVKYLPQFGVQPLVSTVRNGHNFAYDESLLGEVPASVRVFRSNSLETLWLRKVIEKAARRGRGARGETDTAGVSGAPVQAGAIGAQAQGKATGTRAEAQEPDARAEAKVPGASIQAGTSGASIQAGASGAPAGAMENTPRTMKQRIFDFIDDYLFIPDSKVRWLPLGFLSSGRAARREKVDVLFSSSYPYTVHIMALLVQKVHRCPWIADFRDPWVGNEAMAKDIALRRKLDAWLERKVVKNASYVVNVTPSITEMYRARYPEYREKFVTITNGFDPQDFTHVVPHEFDKFTLIHTGILSKKRSPETLVRALEGLVSERPELRDKLQVVFVGYIPEEFRQMFRESAVADLFQVWPYVPHNVCLDYLAGAQLQLLIFDDSPETKAAYSGKIFDYIGAQKPILGFLPQGVAADLIREKGIGSVVGIGDVEEAQAALAKHYDEWANGVRSVDSIERCAEFSRVSLAGQLAELIESTARVAEAKWDNRKQD